MILVTGARGFLGQYLVKELSKLNLPIFLTTSNKKFCRKTNGYPFHYLNFKEIESFRNLPRKIDAVIHLAALVPLKDEVITFSDFMDVNAIGVKHLVESVARRGCKKFIYASTQMVIERPCYLPVDEDHPLVPLSDYGLSKAIGERYCLTLARFLNIKAISLRFARIYGAGQRSGFVLTNFIDQAIKGLPLTIYGDGQSQRDLLYVKDAVKTLKLALDSDQIGIFNIGCGKGITINDLAKTIIKVFAQNRVQLRRDLTQPEDKIDFYFDIRKAQKLLGFKPDYNLRKGLMDYKRELIKLWKIKKSQF